MRWAVKQLACEESQEQAFPIRACELFTSRQYRGNHVIPVIGRSEAATEISGAVASDTTWTLLKSPY